MRVLPSISVITVTYQAEKHLEKTIQSILSQTYPSIDYIIIDGASTDGTLEIIKKYDSQLAYWKSEPDKGLYDAMNKALEVARGDYVLFMNAGDTLYASDTLEKVFQTEKEADVYYGEAQMIDEQTLKPVGLRSEEMPHQLPQNLKWQDMQRGMVVCHQAFIAKRSLVCLYDVAFSYSADVDWVIEVLKKAKKVVHTQQIIATFLQGGLSTKKRKKSLIERFKVLEKHFGITKTIANHIYIVLRGLAFSFKKGKYWKK